MKKSSLFPIILCFILVFSAAHGQNCQNGKIQVVKGGKSHGCNCKRKCINLSEYPAYQALGYYQGGDCIPCGGGHGGTWRMEDEEALLSENSFEIISPNPVSTSAMLSFSLAQAEHALIRVFDITGTLVMKVSDAAMQGDNDYYLNAEELTNGVYIIHLSTESYSATQKVSVLH